MQLVPISSIVIPEDRQRKSFDEDYIRELSLDIRNNCLIHAPTVQRIDGKLVLVAGHCRLKAISTLVDQYAYGESIIDPGMVPVIDIGKVSEKLAFQIELSENLWRKELPWQDRLNALARLHRDFTEENPKQSKAATVQEIFERGGKTTLPELNTALLVTEHMDDEAVARAKTAKEAVAIVTRKLEAKKAAEVAALINTLPTTRHRLILGDCREELKKLDSDLFDVIIVDPPYGIDANKHEAASTSESGYQHKYDDSEEYAMDVMDAIFAQGLRVTKDKAHLYMFCDMRYWDDLVTLGNTIGWDVHIYPIIWSRGGGMIGDYRHKPQRAYDAILYGIKGDRETLIVRPDVINIPALDGAKRHHAAEKPVELYVDLLQRSCRPGNRVLDACCGAGPVFPAANRLSLFATGIELDPDLAVVANSRFLEE